VETPRNFSPSTSILNPVVLFWGSRAYLIYLLHFYYRKTSIYTEITDMVLPLAALRAIPGAGALGLHTTPLRVLEYPWCGARS
jgi:hypothetical protein